MVFSSLPFLFGFLPAFFLIYYLVPCVYQNAVIMVGSLIFYLIGAWHEPLYLVLFVCSILVNYGMGRLIGQTRDLVCRRIFLVSGLLFDFGWLVVFKYTDFFLSVLQKLFRLAGSTAELQPVGLLLPLGISFYTFQMVSYLVDVYRKDVEDERSVVDFFAYVSMFPQLIAGPIVTYQSVRDQLKKERRFDIIPLADGLRNLILGLGLKVIIANQVGSIWLRAGNVGYDSISTGMAWLSLLAFSLQLYFDFWGYSVMALGLGEMMQIRLPKNFDHPYLSVSVTEFWRRWHITLGAWFRDYLYIPLGGNRTTKGKWLRNLLLVWVLTGFWHGADWNFLLWGFLLFVLILVEKLGLKKLLDRFRVFGHVYLLFVIALTWAVFAISDFGNLGTYFQRLFPFFCKEEMFYFEGDWLTYLVDYKYVLTAGILFCTPWPVRLLKRFRNSYAGMVLYLAIFWLAVYCLYMGMNDPFLYFRF